MKQKLGMAAASLAVGLLFAGCATTGGSDRTAGDGPAPGAQHNRKQAHAVLTPKSGSNVKGTVTFVEEVEGVRVTANIQGLTPGPHGFHIHEKGDCSADDATSAGPHFNPTGAPHGAPTGGQHHVGDFGNLEADQRGEVKFNRVFTFLRMDGTNSIVGRAVIVHEKADDLTSQPAGNAGARQACGVIEIVSK
ncbi:MAG: superoxide dismutase family protein [Verrucomicrobiales bacterium]